MHSRVQFAYLLFVTNGRRKLFYVSLTHCHVDSVHFNGDTDPFSEDSLCLRKQRRLRGERIGRHIQRRAYRQGAKH